MGRMNVYLLAALAGLIAPLVGCVPPFTLECPSGTELGVDEESTIRLSFPSATYREVQIAQSSEDGGSVGLRFGLGFAGSISDHDFNPEDGASYGVRGESPGTVVLRVRAGNKGLDLFVLEELCTLVIVAAEGGGGGNGNGNGSPGGNGNANGSPGENGNGNGNTNAGNTNDNGNANAANGNDNGTGGTVLFSDARFDPADWSVMNADLTDTLQANFPQGDPPEPQVTQPEEGGSTLDPAATDELFRQTVTPVYSGDVVVRHLHQSATVDPADGEIEFIEAQMDVVIFDALADGRLFSAFPVIVQGNRVWPLAGSNVALDRPGEWQTLTMGTFGGCGSCGIDLRSGGPITFGFQSQTDGIGPVRYGVDNWKITVQHK